MTPDTIWIIKVILGCLSGLFGVLAAVFTFCETAQNEKYDDTKAWFGAKWQAINRSRWLTLPEQAINWFIQASEATWLSPLGDIMFRPGWVMNTIFYFPPLFMLFICIYYWGGLAGILFAFLYILIPALSLGLSKAGMRVPVLVAGFFHAMVSLGTVVIWTYALLRLSVYYAAPVMLALFPVYWAMILSPIVLLRSLLALDDKLTYRLILFIFGVATGFTATLTALLVGHIADPLAPVPQTFQMLASNVLFDGLTMVVTFAILSWAIGRGWLFSIPLAVFLDLLAAGVLACCSLYFALVNTEHALSVREILNVLVAHSPDGSRVELSPYFWTMHTTFLPTLAYLVLILVTWFAKLILMPVKWFFGKGHEHKSPLKLTAALCGMIAVVFGLFTVGANSAHERAKEKAAAATPPAAVK